MFETLQKLITELELLVENDDSILENDDRIMEVHREIESEIEMYEDYPDKEFKDLKNKFNELQENYETPQQREDIGWDVMFPDEDSMEGWDLG